MTTLPEGILAEPLGKLRDMVASSPAFQAWVGAADYDEALERVHVLATVRNPAVPLCLVDLSDGFERERMLITNARPFEQRGSLVAYFRDAVDPTHSDAEAAFAFCNRLGAVWSELERMAGNPGALLITSIGLAAAPTRIEIDRRQHAGDLYEAALTITFQQTH
jgi:hypothetical protein